MQALHFMFGLGGFLAPLLLKLAHHVEWGFRVRIAPKGYSLRLKFFVLT
jgi:hypothetical protein